MNNQRREAKGKDGMNRIARFARKWMNGMRTLWGCQANLFVKVAAIPVMAGIVLLCCLLDLTDGDKQ